MTLHIMCIRSIFALVAILIAISAIDGRSVPGDSSRLISDGVDRGHDQHNGPPNWILLRGTADVLDDEAEVCEQMYGFLPCSYSIAGHLFLIVVYEYLLFRGESYVASGSEQIFKMLGPGIFGASAFHVLGALPDALILLASGLLNSEEVAQEYVLTGVGLLAGSSILLLTLLWGTCVILGSREFCDGMEPNTSNSSIFSRKFLSSLKGSGIETDLETSYTARIMVLSALPFIVIQIPNIFSIYSAQRVGILCALAVSVGLLLLYFFYQIFEPWVQKRRLEYVKHDQLILRIIQHLQRHALERLLTKDGAPNIHAIRRLFGQIDHDGDDAISQSELKELLLEIKFKHEHVDKDKAVDEFIKEFDINDDQSINKDEFVTGFTKWLEKAKIAMDKRPYSKSSFSDLYQLFQPFILKKREERKLKKQIVAEILAHVHIKSIETLFTENGTPDLPAIRRLFEQIDRNGDNSISQSELKELMMGIKFGDIPFDVDELVLKVMEIFDRSGDHLINEEEFITGLVNLLDTSGEGNKSQAPKLDTGQDDFYQRTWEETDKLVVEDNGKGDVKKSLWIWVKSISLLLLGVIIISVLAEPLISSVQSFSKSAGIPPFFISFILVPLATNARGATKAIKATRHKKARTTSLTFSEIYGEVFMSNMLGFSVLLSLIYARDLTWAFSAEVLVVLIVCGVVGLIASFRSTFPVWTSILAYLLYPLSLLLVYVLDDVLNYS